MESATRYPTKHVVGEDWKDKSHLPLLKAPCAGIDLSAILDPEVGNNDMSSSGGSDDANASGRTSAIDPDQLSRIDEGDEQDESPEWFAKEVWHTCSPEQKAMIKEIEIEARDPEIELNPEDDISHWKEQFNELKKRGGMDDCTVKSVNAIRRNASLQSQTTTCHAAAHNS